LYFEGPAVRIPELITWICHSGSQRRVLKEKKKFSVVYFQTTLNIQ
jgi:hypothetical protein